MVVYYKLILSILKICKIYTMIYVLATKKNEIIESILSNYFREIINNYKFQLVESELLYQILVTKRLLHYRNLQLYLELGMKLTWVHWVLKFKQSQWLKPYINFNIKKDKKTSDSFEKDFFKLMNNSCMVKHWKTLEIE